MKMKKSSKKIVSIVLSLTLIITSLPFMLFSAATVPYDPAPKFSDAAIKEGARAWLDDEGNIQVEYPEAKAEPTFKDEELSIAFYILELVDMGPKNQAHKDTVISTVKATGTRGTFPAADIGEIDLTNNRYSVTVTAVDTQNWFSLPLYATVTEVPVAEIDASRFANFSTSATAVREIMTFDQSDDDTGVVSGNALLYMGVAAEAGTEDLSDNVGDTSALRFIMNTLPNGTQTFDTSLSRQTWDFSNATEVWYWFDLTDVELQGVSFRLRANEKVWYDWGKDQSMTVTQKDYMGDIIYSTKGYTGTDGYVWVQRDDGGWDKVNLTNGTVDLGNFKGYVRVPIQFICSENDSVAQLKNTGFNNGSKDFATGWNSATLTNGDSHANGIPITKMVVDAAGTNIKDARLMQHRIVATKTGIGGLGNENYWHFTNGQWVRNETEEITRGEDAMIAAGLSEAEALSDTDEGYKAIDDLYSAGFAFTGSTSESLENSFYVDNIFFYDENGGPWDSNAVSGMTSSTGNPMSTYYDEESAICKIIFDEIDKYISDPDWADYRELEYILELIEEYRKLYVSQGKDTTFLNLTRQPDTSGLAGMAARLNRTETWEKAWIAYEACASAGTIDASQANLTDWFISNAGKYDLLPLIVNTMEKLPAPEKITSVSKVLRAEIVKLWQAYSLLNLGQLEMLGKDEEEKLLKYFAHIENIAETDGDDFVVGQQLADFPYIVYNDFENLPLGTKAWQIADNKNAYSTDYKSVNGVSAGTHNPDGGVYTMASGWRHTKGLTTYTTNGSVNISNEADYGYSPTDGDDDNEIMNGRLNYDAASVEVTNKGYLHSNAATMNIDSSFTTNNQNGVFHTVTLARQGKDSANWTEFQANNTGLDGLGMLSTQNVTGDTSIGLSLIFYVDFTELESFYFTTNIYTKDNSGTPIKARPNMGIALNDQTKIDDWKYFILDPESGKWVINHTTSQWCFTSEKTDESWGDTLSLDGYKGYIMIPLYHIKVKESAVSEPKLDGNSEWLNNIYAIQFCIGAKNADSLDGKAFTIDNVGFTYDPAGYSNSTISHPSYAEVFEAKSLPAKNFEDAVAAIDPYDETTLASSVQAALDIYGTLPTYQKGVVAQSYAKLEIYMGYVNNPASIPQPDVSAADLQTWIAGNLTTDATGASVTGDKDLVYPGFTTDESGNTTPNYAAYGLTEELAVQLKDYYENSYINYSVAEKQAVNNAGFLNAYNAAMRCMISLGSIKTEAGSYGSASLGTTGSGFLGELSTSLYTRKYDSEGNFLGNFVSIAGREDVQNFKDTKYSPLQYYTKTTIDDGSYQTNVQNISRGFTYFLNNTRSFTVDGEEINGGIITFRDKLQMVYDIASEHINNKVRFTQEELQYVKDILEEYNAFLPAYYNVEELYTLEQAIIGLFAAADITIMDAATGGNQVTTVELNNDSEETMTKTVYVDLSYIAAMLDKTVTLQAESDLKLNQTDGTTYSSLNSFTASSLTADTVVTLGTYDNLYPGEEFARIPIEISVDPSIAEKVPTGARYEGKITFNVYDTADIDAGLTDEELVPIATVELPVVFTSTNGTKPTFYKVEIPANQNIEWDYTGETDVAYKVIEANLEDGTLSVNVADANEDGNNINDMTSTKTDANGTSYKLKYDATGFETKTFTGSITETTIPDPAPSIKIEQDYWDEVPVGEYKTTLTYTVVYDDGSTS